MSLDIKKNPILYSVGTQLAYNIAKKYYDNVHFVWCTTAFNNFKQPPTSNPSTICKRYLEQITTGDQHTKEIENNKVGILRGAKAKLNTGIIDKREYTNIRAAVLVAEYDSFFPVLYIIKSEMVVNKCLEVSVDEKASPHSVEYKIVNLMKNEFEMIFFKDILSGVVEVFDKGEGR
jgi:hypothetical protein